MNEVMRFRDNKIGILKNNPNYLLDVNGSINSTSLCINDVDINTVVNTIMNHLIFSAPLTKTECTISIDLSSYLTTSTASSTYATIKILNCKENAFTFSAPLTRATNTISLDLSPYLTTSTASTTYATITSLNAKENTLTFSAPLTRATNTISLDLSAYATTAALNAKENTLTFSAPLTRTANTISLDTSTYITTTNANALNARYFNDNGNNHGNYTDFNSPTQFGYNYIQGKTNGANVNSEGQYYSWDIGLGANYGFGTYRALFALPRNVANPYLRVRYQENGGYGGWNRISAGYADSADSLTSGIKALTGSLNIKGTGFAVAYGYNTGNGCLTIGSQNVNFGGVGWLPNMGFVMECLDATEITIHDSGNRLTSAMYYSNNNLYFGRNMGWGVSPCTFQVVLQVQADRL